MPSYNLLEILAARVLDVSPSADESMVQSAYRDKVGDWHPDVSDDPDAQEKFLAADTARNILTGEIDFSDADRVSTAESTLRRLFSDDEIEEAARESADTPRYSSSAQKRTDPESYTPEDFMGMSQQERSEMIQRVALGVETTIVYEAIQGLYEQGYDKADFFHDINDYIGSQHPDSIDFGDFYEATEDSLRQGVTEKLFSESIEKVQSELQQEYGDGATLREVGRIVSYFIVQGGIDLGIGARFVGSSSFGRDDRFSRGRGSDPRFGRDSRFDR